MTAPCSGFGHLIPCVRSHGWNFCLPIRRALIAISLFVGAAIPCSLDLVPSEHGDQGRYLRLTKLPVNEHANTVLVAKLEFDRLPNVLGPAKESGASIL